MSQIEWKPTEIRGFKELEMSHPFPAQVSLALLSVAQPHVCAMALDEAGKYLRDRDGLAAAVLRHFGNLEHLMTGSVALFKVTRASLGACVMPRFQATRRKTPMPTASTKP